MVVIALSPIPGSLISYFAALPTLAQTATPSPFVLPREIASGTTLRVDGSASMARPNEDIKRRFERRYPGTTVTLATDGSDQAIQKLLAGEVDVAAIGRPLSEAELAQGLVQVPIQREKIAIILGPDNPFQGNLTFDQFAQMFRGEITNWSEVGGPDLPVRFIDRPDDSDTRRALSTYQVFKGRPFETGATATQVADDQTATVIQALGNSGISYAIADQVVGQPNVRVLVMHGTLPDDPRYPYSQPRVYVYRGTPTPAVQGFLAFATVPPGQDPAEASAPVGAASPALPSPTPASPVTASPEAVPPATVAPSEAAVPPSTNIEGGIPGWLPVVILGALAGLGALVLRGRGGSAPPATSSAAAPSPPITPPSPAAAPPIATSTSTPTVSAPDATVAEPAGSIPAGAAIAGAGLAGAAVVGAAIAKPKSRIVLTPRNHADAYAYWEAPEAHKAEVRAQGGKDLKLRIYDVTGLDPEGTLPVAYQEYAVAEEDVDRHVPIMTSDRDYLAELGYTTPDRQWLPLARSNSVRVPAAPEVAAIAPEPASTSPVEAPAAAPPAVAAPPAPPISPLPAPEPEVAPVAEPPTPQPVAEAVAETVDPSLALGAAALAAGAGAVLASRDDEDEQSHVEAAKFDVGQTDLSSEQLADVDEGLPDLPDGYGESRIVLLPRDPQWAYTYWDTPNEHKLALRQQGGERLALRLMDVTGIDLNVQHPHSIQQYDCDELARDWYLPIPVSDRDYLVEIGYLAADGRWLLLARSNTVRVPPVFPSDWHEDLFMTLSWDESLEGRTFITLVPPGQRVTDTGNPIYDEIFGLAESAESQRVAGSLFGSMQHVPGSHVPGSAQHVPGSAQHVPGSVQHVPGSVQHVPGSVQRVPVSVQHVPGSVQHVPGSAFGSMQMASGAALSSVPITRVPPIPAPGITPVSSYVFPSGVGMGVVPTFSGLTMSGVGVFGSMPPIRSRKFWLVADAELIVYGATEPDAKVYIAGREIPLNPDGTFRFQMSFQDGLIDYPILAIAADGEQSRAIHMKFTRETPNRNTNSKEDAKEEPF